MKTRVRMLGEHRVIQGDCLDVLKQYPDDSVDLVMCSPPYLDCRLYGALDFKLKCDEWVPWALERYLECCRVSRGLVAWVVEGKTKNYTYQPAPFLLMAELYKRGIKLRKPVVFHRVGIPGSGGPDWLRNDWEPIVCASKGKLPWSDNTACGHPPKWAPGGEMSHRASDGTRVNERMTFDEKVSMGAKIHTKPDADGKRKQAYLPPKMANPGNVVSEDESSDFFHAVVGGGLMGSKLAHENEAPYPETLVDFFVRSFCPPRGIVLDPFGGSGTTLAVAIKTGRVGYCIDARPDQAELMVRRHAEAQSTVSHLPVNS